MCGHVKKDLIIRMQRTEAIKRFLNHKTHSDLAALYNYSMEVQVVVAQDGGERISGEYKGAKWHGYTDGIQTWKPFRIPWNAYKEPEYKDSEINFDLIEHAEGIGMTGWNWEDQLSYWVAYDFDSIIGHNKGLSTQELKNIADTASKVPWVTLRKSTGGQGLHLYVHLDNPEYTKTHTEHSALARAILGKLSAETGYPFSAKVDICGGNMWVWHRKMERTNEGLILIKEGISLSEAPINWKDHIDVVQGKRKRSIPKFAKGQENVEKLFEQLSGQRSHTKIDKEHQALIEYLNKTGALWWWDSDRNMLVCHTADLDKAHQELGLRGVFKTLATGKERGVDQNCYCFNLPNGGWVVRRHSPGCQEADTWTQDGSGWTKCYFNVNPDFNTAASAFGGVEMPKGGFMFTEAEMAVQAVESLGAHITIPTALASRNTKLKHHKDGRIIIEIEASNNDTAIPGWIRETKNFTKVIGHKVKEQTEPETADFDEIVRHLISESKEDCGWSLQTNGIWVTEPIYNIKTALESLGFKANQVKQFLGSCIFNPWTVTNKPFQSEYPGNRLWNKKGAKLHYIPTKGRENLKYPTWMKILAHCGKGLDEAIKENGWAINNNVQTGGDYLKIWLASLFQFPEEPLPYLFFYGKQKSGKSSFSECIGMLMTHGHTKANLPLMSKEGFNGELEGAVVCSVEEIDLSKHKMAYNRIKDWVTSKYITIHPKGQTPFQIPNTTHWIQTANDYRYCPIFPGDTRITMIELQTIDPLEMIPRKFLEPKLETEASDFLGEILALEIPKSNDRLNVPIIETDVKLNVETMNMSPLERFIEDHIYPASGNYIIFKEFYEKFYATLDLEEQVQWTKHRVSKELPPNILKGRLVHNNHVALGNVSWNKEAELNKPYRVIQGKLFNDR